MGDWSWCIILILSFHLFLFSQSVSPLDPDSMDDFLHLYGRRSLIRPKTGTLYQLSLPGNFSGIRASIVRFRTTSLWRMGANLSFLQIPSRAIVTMPFVHRLDLVFQDLGNWSDSYFHVPNHTLITPVLGFRAYDANSTNRTILFGTSDHFAISVRFSPPEVARTEHAIMKCVRFNPNGSFEFIDKRVVEFTCKTVEQGHFAIVVPVGDEERKQMLWKWWVMGFCVGLGFLVFLVVSGLVLYWGSSRKMILTMEKRSEMDVGLETTWVGRSKMPTASGIRTQPSLEE